MIFNNNNVGKLMVMVAIFATSLCVQATEVTYRIVEFNKTTGDFFIAASGMVPINSYVYFENPYGATTGNRYNQIPRNKQAVFYLDGWQGCRINSITFSMCSNSKSGQAGLVINDGDTQLYNLRSDDFASDTWFGQWVSKDFGVYVDITKHLDIPAFNTDEASITVKGGTSEGSVYLNAITIDYDEAPGSSLESPLGWIYEKLTKKSTLAEGDEIMLFRNGCAATDIDGMEKSHYLDAIPVASTSDVSSNDVLCFTLGKGDEPNYWTMTSQYGHLLGATAKQTLAWDEGSTQWTISLGYDGATITNANANYGTMRYNAPAESYARFNLYTSKTLPLPFIYRKDRQREPEISSSLAFDNTDLTVSLDEGHIALRPTLKPASTTDQRIQWSSNNESVATVNGGYVTLVGVGTATISAQTKDGGASATVRITVNAATGIDKTVVDNKSQTAYKTIDGHRIVVRNKGKRYGLNGIKL